MELSRAPVLHRPPPEPAAREAPPRRGVPRSLVLASELGWRFLVVVGAIAVLAYGLWSVRLVALPAFLALLLSTILVPPVRWLCRRGLPRALATATVFAASLVVVGIVAMLVVPAFAAEATKLSDTITGGAHELGRLVASGPFGVSRADAQSAIDGLSDR